MLDDRDIREPLFAFLEETFGKVRILEEKRTGRARADVVMITPQAVCGVEIKSDADSYARLAGQVRNYDQYYDLNYVVIGTSHAQHIEEHVPRWWGIITVEEIEGGTDFYIARRADISPEMDPEKKMSILWRRELVHLQEINGLPRYREKSKKFVAQALLERVDAEVLGQQICEELFERDYTTIEEDIAAYREEHGRRRRKVRKTKKKHGQ